MTTYANYAAKTRSEKLVLCWIEPKQRLMVWTLHSGSVYKRTTSHFVVDILEGTTSLSEGTSATLNQGEWWYDPDTSICYIRTSDDSNPNTKNVVATYRKFYANAPLDLPFDLSSGSDVHYEGILKGNSPIVKQLDEEQIGIALESNTNITLDNGNGLLDEIYDTLFWENKRIRVWSWNEDILLANKQLLFDGEIQDKSFSQDQVQFKCKDFMYKLREPLPLDLFDSGDGSLSADDLNKPKRRIYGKVDQVQCIGVDKTLDGYTLTGTIAGTLSSSTVTGTGTSFLDECSPNDTIKITLNNNTYEYGIDSVDSDTQLTLTETIEDSFTGQTVTNSPNRPWRKSNRNWHIAGHKLRAPTTTVSAATQPNRFTVASPSDIFADDKISVAGESATIRRIDESGNIVLTANLQAGTPSVSDAVLKNPVSKAYFGKDELIITRDWTVTNSTEAILNLTNTAEFNVAKAVNMAGTLTFTASSRTVTASGVDLVNEIQSRDWIKGPDLSHTTWYEVLSVSESSLTLRVAYAGSNVTDTGSQKKNVELIGDDALILVNCAGMENASSTWIKTASDAVRDMLVVDAGLSVNESSFTDSDTLMPYTLSMVIPESVGGDIPKIRDVVTKINESVFGSLINNSDFELVYNVLSPDKPTDILTVEDHDILEGFTVKSKNEIVRKVNVHYRPFVDRFSGNDAFKLYEETSTFVDNYIGAKQELEKTVYLYEDDHATEIAQRYAFYNSLSQSTITFKSKLNLTLKNLNDKLLINLDRIYKRFGGQDRRKVGTITKISKDGYGTSVEINDLGNIHNRCTAIADNSANDFTSATDSEKIVNSYICDDSLEIPDTSDDQFLGCNIIG